MKVKICGLREPGHAVFAARAGADMLGFVFAESRRRVTPDEARHIIREVIKLKLPAQTVGVFVNEAVENVNRIADKCGLDYVQLSGGESPEYALSLARPVIKTFHVLPGQDREDVLALVEEWERAAGRRDLYLLDTGAPEAYGGTGQAFDWDVLSGLSSVFPFIVAGGLNPQNVGSLIQAAIPWGVDVSSGVETGGVKDTARITAFIEAARRGH